MGIFKFDKDKTKFYSQFSPEKKITINPSIIRQISRSTTNVSKVAQKIAACVRVHVLSGLKHSATPRALNPIECVRLTSSNSQIHNKRATKGLSSSGIRGTKFIPVYNFPAQ